MRNLATGSLFVALALPAVASSHPTRWQPPHVVTIDDEKAAVSNFPWFPTFTLPADGDEGTPQALLLRDGDYIYLLDDSAAPPVRYLDSDGPIVKATFNQWSFHLGETVVALSLAEEDGRKWFAAASDGELADLRTVAMPEHIDPASFAAIQQLAAVNPNVDLAVDSVASLRRVLTVFEPRALFVGLNEKVPIPPGLLAYQPQLETLVMIAPNPGSLNDLPTLPRLRRLMLGDWKTELSGPLPDGLSELESLTVSGSDMKDLSALQAAPPGLQELFLDDLSQLADLSGLETMTGLEALRLGESPVALPTLAALRNLRWASLPRTIDQEQFAAFVSAHPALTFLQLSATENAIDLLPLRILKDLEGLVLGGAYENLEVIEELSSLRYLGISKASWEPGRIAAILKALPDSVVVRVSPLCLGSGWILLLVPILGFAWLRQHKRQAGAR
jgi:hypothetical protein